MKVSVNGEEKWVHWDEMKKLVAGIKTGRRFWNEGQPIINNDGDEVVYLGAN